MDTAPPKVKICGITNGDDARLAVGHGAWAIGMIFYDRSPRRCRPADAEAIVAEHRRQAEMAGVFVNPTLGEVTAMAERVGLTMVQLHGDEGPAFCAEVARRTGAKVIKAAQVRSLADVRALQPFHTDYHLLDSHARGLRGGTGEVFEWKLVRAHDSGPPAPPVILSGGLRPDNVAAAIAATEPFAVDTASGTEAAPGRKDPALLEAFFAAVRSTAPAPAPAEGVA